MRRVRCKNCGGLCGPVCRGLGLPSRSVRALSEVAETVGLPTATASVPGEDKRERPLHVARPYSGVQGPRAPSDVRPIQAPSAKKGQGGRPRKGAEQMTN